MLSSTNVQTGSWGIKDMLLHHSSKASVPPHCFCLLLSFISSSVKETRDEVSESVCKGYVGTKEQDAMRAMH